MKTVRDFFPIRGEGCGKNHDPTSNSTKEKTSITTINKNATHKPFATVRDGAIKATLWTSPTEKDGDCRRNSAHITTGAIQERAQAGLAGSFSADEMAWVIERV